MKKNTAPGLFKKIRCELLNKVLLIILMYLLLALAAWCAIHWCFNTDLPVCRKLWQVPYSTAVVLKKFEKCTGKHFRSSHRRCSVRNGVLRNFTKFTGKQLCQSPFLNEVAGLRQHLWATGSVLSGNSAKSCFWLGNIDFSLPQACSFIKKETGVFLWILRNFLEHLFYRIPLGDCFSNLRSRAFFVKFHV